MAFPLTDLVDEISTLSKSQKRPDREVRSFIRELSGSSFTGTLNVGSVTKTIAYTKRQELRDGNTIKAVIPETDYTIELRVAADVQVEKGGDVTCTFCLYKFDGYTKTIHAYQLETEPPEESLNTDINVKEAEAADSPSTTTTSSDVVDPLAKFQAEALATLSQDDTNVTSDTSLEEDLLNKLQREAEQRLVQLNEDFDETIIASGGEVAAQTDSDIPESIEAIDEPPAETEPVTSDLPEPTAAVNKPESKNQEPNTNSESERSEKDNDSPTSGETIPTPSKAKAVPIKQPKQDAGKQAKKVPKSPANDAGTDSNDEALLDELTQEALGGSDAPITLDLLSAIVSIQTGIPVDTVHSIQKTMWTHISTPSTFGEGKATYKFPLLGKFTVRQDSENVSLDFASTQVDDIAKATIDETIGFEKAKQLANSNSGPLIARHVVPLALTTASSLGLQQAQAYLTIYRTILLMLRILAKGERRIRIDDVGEFFPSIVAGSEAYRFRAYPTLLRATSSAFKDASVFLSKRGEAQDRFDATSEDVTPQNSDSALKGCLTILAIIIGLVILASLGN